MSYVRLDRKMLSWGWKDDPKMVALWIHILLEANWKENEWHGQKFEQGTFPTSVEKLSVATGLSTKSVRTCLEKLKKSGEIVIETANKGTKISVVKWAEYQGSDDADGILLCGKEREEDSDRKASGIFGVSYNVRTDGIFPDSIVYRLSVRTRSACGNE